MKQSEFVVEDIGVLVAPFDPGDRIDHLQLDRIVGKIQQRFGQQKAPDEDQHAHGVEEQRIGDCAEKEQQEARRKRRRCDAWARRFGRPYT